MVELIIYLDNFQIYQKWKQVSIPEFHTFKIPLFSYY